MAISAEGKKRRAEAGYKNLMRWAATHQGQANLRHGIYAAMLGAPVSTDLRERLDKFEVTLRREKGREFTALEAALVESCKLSLATVHLAQELLLSTPITSRTRKKSAASTLEVVAAHQNTLRRHLVLLGLTSASSGNGEQPEVPPTIEQILLNEGVADGGH